MSKGATAKFTHPGMLISCSATLKNELTCRRLAVNLKVQAPLVTAHILPFMIYVT